MCGSGALAFDVKLEVHILKLGAYTSVQLDGVLLNFGSFFFLGCILACLIELNSMSSLR